MKFKKQLFGFMDMLRFKKLVPNRREALANGPDTPLPEDYRTNQLARRLHPGQMQVELTEVSPLTPRMSRFTFRRLDGDAFPFFRAGQYVSLRTGIDGSLVSRAYSIASSPRDALANRLVLGVEKAGFFSGYLHDGARPGDIFTMSEPCGEFHYETLRDKKHIVCLAGGCGITPFLSMASSMAEGDEDYQMTLFYGARDMENIAFRAELDALAEKGLQVIYVLSEETRPGYEHGFITGALLEKYVDVHDVTFFLCGPPAMYDFVRKELAAYNLPVKAIHQDVSYGGYRDMDSPRTFRLTVHIRDQVTTVDAREDETLLIALERAGVKAPNRCRAGGCGYCHSKWLAGEYLVAPGRDGRREADRKFGFIHPCVTYPLGDMEIEIPAAP